MTVTRRDPRRFIFAFGVVGLVLLGIVVVSVSVLTAPTPTRQPTSTLPVIAATASPSPSPTPTPVPTPVPTPTPAPLPSTPPTIGAATLAQTDSGGTWRIHFVYPQIQSGTSPLAAQINAEIKAEVETTATQFSVGPAANPRTDGLPNTLEGSYTPALVRARLFSFRFTEVEDLGGAHPATTLLTVTYDLTTGQRLGLADLFADLPAGLAIISDASKAALHQQLGDAYDSTVVNDGTAPTAQNFAAWALTANGLEITFEPYQVAPSAFGMPVVVVPWSDLQAVLDPSSAAAELWKGS